MKNYVIQSGNFTSNGNFSGYTATGVRVHIHKNQMDSKGWKKTEDVKYPFFAVGEVKKIGQLDENSQPRKNADGTPVLIDRLTATSVFATKEQLIGALVDERTIDIAVTANVVAEAKKAGLTEADMKQLLAEAV